MSRRSLEGILALKERKREMDDVWLLTVVVMLLALGVLWFQRILDIELAAVTWTAVGYGCVYFLIGLAADHASTARAYLVSVAALQVTGVLMLAAVWRLSGGLQNPMLLLVFVLPVMTGTLVLPRGQAYATAALAVIVVLVVALIDSPALRWYVWQIGLPVRGLVNLLGQVPATTVHPFPAAADAPPYLAAIVCLFGVLMFAVASVADAIGTVAARLQRRSAVLSKALTKVESLSAEALGLMPWPTALIYADTFRVAQASRSFFQQFFLDPDATADQNFFGLLKFSYPDAVEALLGDRGGVLPLSVVWVRGERRLMSVHVSHLNHEDTRYALVSLQEITDAHYLRLALDAIDEPVIVLSSNRVVAFNPAAEAVIDNLAVGVDASQPLATSHPPFAWWALGVRTRQECDVRFGEVAFRGVSQAVVIPGEREPLTIITLEPQRDQTGGDR